MTAASHELRGARAFTLPEVLLTLGITSAIMVTLVSLLRTVGEIRLVVERDARWRMAAEGVLSAIHDEIRSGWRPDEVHPSLGARLRIDSHRFDIRVDAEPRQNTPFTFIRYEFDTDESRMLRSALSATASDETSTVLGDVSAFTVDSRHDSLVIGIRSTRDGYVEREIPLKNGGIQ